MSKYHRLTQFERYQISSLLDSGFGIRKIAGILKRSPSTICRELKKNRNPNQYYPGAAHKTAKWIRSRVYPPRKIRGILANRVRKLLELQWSPEQISGRLKLEGIYISHETIYQFIYRDFPQGGTLYKNLRRKRKTRRSRQTTRNLKRAGHRIDRHWIDERPTIVETRSRLGDFERDLVLGKNRKPNLLTIVDRTSKYTKIAKVQATNSYEIHQATISALKGLPLETITNDNGTEFSMHDLTSKELSIQIYFNHPYRSWERGTNENTNGLIRQYFPKGTDLSKVSNKQIQAVEDLLNKRPRKTLGFRNPIEVQNQMRRVLR